MFSMLRLMITVAHLARVYTHMYITTGVNHKALRGTSYVKNSTFRDKSHEIYCNGYVNQ